MHTHNDLRTGRTYRTLPPLATVRRVQDMRTGRDHARHSKATARAVLGAAKRLGWR